MLAGGFGTRLAHVVPNVCKPMAPVAGEPFLRRVLDQLDCAGFARVIIADGYRREQIESYFMGTYRGLEIDYSSEDTPLLTGGAIKRALKKCSQSEIFVLNGDTWFDVDFRDMEHTLLEHSGAQCCVAAKRMENFDRYGTLDIRRDGVVRSFREKMPCSEGLINGGVYLIRNDALDFEPEVFSFENDWLERVVDKDIIVACEADGDFIDIGVPEDYRLAQTMFSEVEKGYNLALFDRDGTINVDTGHMHKIEDCEFIDSTIKEMRRYSENSSWRIAVVTNQAGIAKGMYSVDEMRVLHRQMSKRLKSRGVEVDAWYFCPHHPDYTGACECRKPALGMLLRAMRDFHSSPMHCVMYGDSKKDLQAAMSANISFKSIGDKKAL